MTSATSAITFHFFGPFTVRDFYENTGFLYKTIIRVGPGGPFTVTATAKGTTLTQQNSSFVENITYNSDGSVKTRTDNGPYNKFTAPRSGIVWLDTGRIVVDGDFNVLFVAGPRQNASSMLLRCVRIGATSWVPNDLRDRLHHRRVLIRDHPERDAIASMLMRYHDQNGQGWADVLDLLTMYPDARRRVVRLLGEMEAEWPLLARIDR